MNIRISKVEAERIINTLSDGVPVPEHIMDYSSEVDTTLLENVKNHLSKVSRSLAIARFVRGDYGSGKSHFLNLVRTIALRENFVVSYFDLRAREGFDMIERIFSKLIRTVSVFDKREGDIEETVLDFILKEWAIDVKDTDEAIKGMPLDITNMDFVKAISLYGQISSGSRHRISKSLDLIELLNRWFQAESLLANERREIGVRNNINVRNARDYLNQLAIFFKSIGYSGWVILIDEQEIIPTLMSRHKRNLSNENLKVVIDTTPKTKHIYYLFATTPEFFTDATNGINAYPALRQRVHDVLEVHPMSAKEMTEAGKKIKEIFCIAYPDFDRGLISEMQIKSCSKFMDDAYLNISSKARVFIISYIKLLEKLKSDKSSKPQEDFQAITGVVWDELEKTTREAFSTLE